MSIIVFFAVLLLLGSAATNNAIDGVKGFQAPIFKVERNDSVVSLDDMRGHWVLLQFWSSSDAPSRIAGKQYTAIEQKLNDGQSAERFHLLSVNMDRSERLFREIVRRDNLNAETQFRAQGEEASKIIDAYRLDNGFQSFLIDPQGKIVATNPDPETVARIVAEG